MNGESDQRPSHKARPLQGNNNLSGQNRTQRNKSPIKGNYKETCLSQTYLR